MVRNCQLIQTFLACRLGIKRYCLMRYASLFVVPEQRQRPGWPQILPWVGIFLVGNLDTVRETKDVKETQNLGRRLAAVSSAGLVQEDWR